MRNMNNLVGDVDELRREREARNNPPDFEPGQGSDDDWSFLDEGGSSMDSVDNSAFMGSDFNSVSSGGGFDSNLSSFGNSIQGGNQNNNPQKMPEDKYFDLAKDILKYIFKYLKELFKSMSDSFSECDAIMFVKYGNRIVRVSAIVTGIGAVLEIIGWFSNGVLHDGFYIAIGGLLSFAIGCLFMFLNLDKARELDKAKLESSSSDDLGDTSEYENEETPVEDEEEDSWSWGDDSYDDDSYDEEEVSEEYEDSYKEDIWSSLEETVEEDNTPKVYEEDINIDSAIENITDIPPHTQTRQYLFEEYSKVLPLINPDFAELKVISENNDNFVIFDKILQDAAIQVGTKEDKLPYLVELRENQFIIQLKASRPTGLKEEDIANEIANIYSRDEYGAIEHEGVYATTSSVGANYIINIFKGENSLISLADTYREVKDFILDPKVKKPVVVGVNELGKVHKIDADKVYSYIFSGKPRTGKSWGVVSLVLQLCMYSSPKEVTFEAFDVKNTSSDFYSMKDYLPHFKVFKGSKNEILSRLRYLTTVEADRREKIL